MEKLIEKLDPEDVKTLLQLLRDSKGANTSTSGQPQTKLDLPSVDIKLDGPGTYLSWSRRIIWALQGKCLDGWLTGEKSKPAQDTAEREDWRSTHELLYTWLLNSMVQSISVTVDGLQSVPDIWAKLKRTYGGADNNMRVFQI